MIYTKFFVNTIHLIVQKIDNIMHIYIKKKFANIWVKNII